MDERQRAVVSRDNDRAFNPGGKNSFAAAAASSNANAASASSAQAATASAVVPVLSTPTRPLLLYWTDGAKRTLPFLLLKAVALRRGAARLGLPAPAEGSSSASSPIRPDRLVQILGGSNALDAQLLDDKCRMQALLAHKKYVPHTESFDITREGWEEVLRKAFRPGGLEPQPQSGDDDSSNGASTATISVEAEVSSHLCTLSCSSRFLILKPSLGHKQRGILILPHCLLHLPTALIHTRAQRRPGGFKGVFESWVVQQYVMQPLTISGADIGLLYEEGETMKRKEGGRAWRKMITAPRAANANANANVNANANANGSSNASAPIFSPRSSPSPPAAAFSSSSSSSSSSAAAPSSIRHTLSPSLPFLPSDSGFSVLARGLFKLHFRLYAMVCFDARTGGCRTFYCNLAKIYHAKEHMAEIQLQHHKRQLLPPTPPLMLLSSSSSAASDFDSAASYFLAPNRPSSPVFPPPPVSRRSRPSLPLSFRSHRQSPSRHLRQR